MSEADMDHHLDINLLPDPEFPATILMNSLYSKFHKALCDIKSTTIGISFPGYRKTLGSCLRLHGTAEALDKLMSRNWIGPMSGYCSISGIHPVPDTSQHRTVSRKQPTKSPAKLRRQAKRGHLTEEQTENYIAKMISDEGKLTLPYLEMVSGSNSHRHRRYIVLGPLLEHAIKGEFDQFGLSKTATVPWF